jgi:hypothetical protein
MEGGTFHVGLNVMYFREVRDHHREVARYYIQLAEKEKPSSVKTVTIG